MSPAPDNLNQYKPSDGTEKPSDSGDKTRKDYNDTGIERRDRNWSEDKRPADVSDTFEAPPTPDKTKQK
jgi:hypothetical protein